jgi:predicted metal-dependent hydrolase
MKFNRSGQLQINVPHRTQQSFVNDYIKAKFQWIKSQKEKLNSQIKQKELSYENGGLHEFMGDSFPLELIKSHSSQVYLKHDKLQVCYRKNSSVKNILATWYKNQALEYFTKRTKYFALLYDLPTIKAIKIRNMRARWGSCNSRSEITYNTHLIKKSKELIDYVIIHELCHLIHLNHSPSFYRLQTQMNPNWKVNKNRLNQS